MIDFVFHRLERKPTRGLRQGGRVFVINVEGCATDDVHHGTSMQIIEFFRMGHDEVSRPEQAYFPFGEWHGDDSEWTEFILETAKPL